MWSGEFTKRVRKESGPTAWTRIAREAGPTGHLRKRVAQVSQVHHANFVCQFLLITFYFDMFDYLSHLLSASSSNSSSLSSSPGSSQSSSHTSCSSSSGFYSSCSSFDNCYTDDKDWYQICDQYSSNFYTPSCSVVQAPFKFFPP